jgi:hypothetical protein
LNADGGETPAAGAYAAGGDLFDSHGRTGDAAPPGRALVADRLRLEVTNAPPHAIHEAAIRPKRAYEAASPDDGVRILVDRLRPRGVSKANAAIDRWMKEGRAEYGALALSDVWNPPNCDVHGRDPRCPVNVDSGRPLSANSGRPEGPRGEPVKFDAAEYGY